MGDDTDETAETLEPIAYLARSENRFRVLEVLTETIPKPGQETPGYEPRELREVTGASDATVSRILNEFQERGWAERNDAGEYVATPEGQHLAVQFEPIAESVQTIQELEAEMAMVPATELRVGPTDSLISLDAFRNATIHRPSPYDPNPLGEKIVELTNESTTLYTFTYYTIPPEVWEATYGGVTSGRLTNKAILAGGNLEHIYNLDRSFPDNDELRELAALPAQTVYRYDGHFPCNLFIGDERVLLENAQVSTIEPMTTLESHDETVRQWALDVWENYRGKSDEVPIDELLE